MSSDDRICFSGIKNAGNSYDAGRYVVLVI